MAVSGAGNMQVERHAEALEQHKKLIRDHREKEAKLRERNT
mgnify:CR=1 FL=1